MGKQLAILEREGRPASKALDLRELIQIHGLASGPFLTKVHFLEVLRAWTRIPPPLGQEGMVDSCHSGTDCYMEWEILKSPLNAMTYPRRGYMLALAKALAEASGTSFQTPSASSELVSGHFEYFLGDWISRLKEELSAHWVREHQKDDFRSAIPDAWLKRSGADLVAGAFCSGNEGLALALIGRGVSPTAHTTNGEQTLLESACQYGSPKSVRICLAAGAAIYRKAPFGAPVVCAVRNEAHPLEIL